MGRYSPLDVGVAELVGSALMENRETFCLWAGFSIEGCGVDGVLAIRVDEALAVDICFLFFPVFPFLFVYEWNRSERWMGVKRT